MAKKKKALPSFTPKSKNKANPKGKEKKFNPFEVHTNRVKHEVLGRSTKHEKGLPGVARSRANQQV